MKKPIRLALVGCGGISGCHVAGYKDLVQRGCQDFVFTACCDSIEANARKRAGELAEIQGTAPKVFADIPSLLRAKVADGADLCLPHHLHLPLGIEALEGGLHVMIEKPLGITIQASRQLIDAAKRNQRILATAENTRRCLASRAGAWAINKRKLIGDIGAVHVAHIAFSPFDYNAPMFKWRGVKLLVGGGMIMDSGAHFADMQRVLFGEVDEVSCTMATHDQRLIPEAPVFGDVKPDVEDTWHADIRFKSGIRTSWSYSRALPGPTLRFGHYFGTQGTLEDLGWVFHCFEGGAKATLAGDQTMSKDEIEKEYLMTLTDEEKARLFPYGCTHNFGIEVWDFADAIRNHRKPEVDGEEGLRSKALCEACFESAAMGGKPVKYDEVLSGKVNAYQKPIDEYWKI